MNEYIDMNLSNLTTTNIGLYIGLYCESQMITYGCRARWK
jgi:hypothetical protein